MVLQSPSCLPLRSSPVCRPIFAFPNPIEQSHPARLFTLRPRIRKTAFQILVQTMILKHQTLVKMNEECYEEERMLWLKHHWKCTKASNKMYLEDSAMEEIRDTVKALMQTEQSYRTVPVRRRPAEWRRKIGQWAYRVIDHFGVDREVVGIAMNFLDRFLMENLNNSRKYQLSAMTCLYLALKLHTRSYRTHLRVLAELSRGQFVERDIVELESIVLETLDYRVHPPMPMTFVRYFLQYYEHHSRMNPSRLNLEENRHDEEEGVSTPDPNVVWQVVHEIARYGTELAVLDTSCCAEPSQLAYACIIAAMDILTEDALPESCRREFRAVLKPLIQLRPQESFLTESLAQLLSPELLVLEHHSSHPIAMAWDRHWLRNCADTSLPKDVVPRHPSNVESPVSVL